jgi:hypothetical protein
LAARGARAAAGDAGDRVEWVGADEKRTGPLLDKGRETLIEVVFSDCVQDNELEPKRARCGLRVPRLRLGNRTCWIDE